MEIRNRTELLVKKDDKEFLFVCTNDATLGLVFDAITEMKAYVMQKIKESEEKPPEAPPQAVCVPCSDAPAQ